MSDENAVPGDDQPYAFELHLPNDDYSLVYAGYLANYATEAERACDNIPLYLRSASEVRSDDLYVWFAEPKPVYGSDGERFIRAWTADISQVDGLRNSIGRDPIRFNAAAAAPAQSEESIYQVQRDAFDDNAWYTVQKDTWDRTGTIWRRIVYAAPQPAQITPPDAAEFKNFHRLLCERFDYTHDDKDWKRDQLSLIEWIAAAPQPALTEEQIGAVEKAVGLLWGLGRHADARTLRDLIPAARPASGADHD